MSALRCFVVDDEPLACDLIAGYVRQTPFLELAGCYTNALSVMEALQSDEQIDLLFWIFRCPISVEWSCLICCRKGFA